MHADNVNFASLSSTELEDLRQFEKEFAAKYGNNIYLLAFNQES